MVCKLIGNIIEGNVNELIFNLDGFFRFSRIVIGGSVGIGVRVFRCFRILLVRYIAEFIVSVRGYLGIGFSARGIAGGVFV